MNKMEGGRLLHELRAKREVKQYDILLLMPSTRYYHFFSEIRKKKPDFLGGHITLQDV